MQISFIQDKNNQFYLQIVNGASGNGFLDVELFYTYNGAADKSK